MMKWRIKYGIACLAVATHLLHQGIGKRIVKVMLYRMRLEGPLNEKIA